jgi:anoctamin-10
MVYTYHTDHRWKRIARGMLQIPFGLAAGVGLAAVLTWIFSVEVFMSEVYSGPFKQFLVRLQRKRNLL